MVTLWWLCLYVINMGGGGSSCPDDSPLSKMMNYYRKKGNLPKSWSGGFFWQSRFALNPHLITHFWPVDSTPIMVPAPHRTFLILGT